MGLRASKWKQSLAATIFLSSRKVWEWSKTVLLYFLYTYIIHDHFSSRFTVYDSTKRKNEARLISDGFHGLPVGISEVDASFAWSQNRKLYIFKGTAFSLICIVYKFIVVVNNYFKLLSFFLRNAAFCINLAIICSLIYWSLTYWRIRCKDSM